MSDQFWLTKAQLKRIEPFFPRTRGIPRVDDRRVVSGIVHVIRNGLRWRAGYGPISPRANAGISRRGFPLRVKSRHRVTSASCPLCPQKRTFVSALSMSALCHKRTSVQAVIPCSSRQHKSGHRPSCRRSPSRRARPRRVAATSRWSLLSFPRWHSA
jgi:hypothetical protein